MIAIQGKKLVDTETGEILSPDISPRFSALTYDDYVKQFPCIRCISPMTCTAHQNYRDLDGESERLIIEKKLDGFRGMLFITKDGNRMFSRQTSKLTNWAGEMSDNLVHIRDYPFVDLEGTIFDGELTIPGGEFKDVAGICGSATLSNNALLNQVAKGFAEFNVFDILYYRGVRVENFPLWRRKELLHRIFEKHLSSHPSIKLLPSYSCHPQKEMPHNIIIKSIENVVEAIWNDGGEGVIIKDIDSIYEHKRAKSWMKVKEMHYKDVFIMGYNAPTKTFEADERKTSLDDWEYWESGAPVTKPYAKGWIGSIIVGTFDESGKEVKVADVKGLSDELLEYIKEKGESLIGTVIEIKFNGWNDETKLTTRHPRYSRDRSAEKVKEDCTWESWIKS